MSRHANMRGIVHHWAEAAGLDSSAYGTHSMRRTKATLIYQRARRICPGRSAALVGKLEATVRYLGIEVVELEISEQTEIPAGTLRLHRGTTRAAAFWHHVVFVQSATSGLWPLRRNWWR